MEAPKPKVGVLMTVLELYRKVMPDWAAPMETLWRAQIEEALSNAADLHFTPVAFTADDVARAVASCSQADCDLLLLLPLAYAPSGAAVKALSETKLPLLVVSSARDQSLPYDMADDHIMANHAIHAVQDVTNVLGRTRRPFDVLAGHPTDARFCERLAAAARTAAAARVFISGRVGRIGQQFTDMLDFDPGPDFAAKFGIRLAPIQPADLAAAADDVATQRVRELVQWAHAELDVDPDLTTAELDTSARHALALEDIVNRHSLDAVSMNFLALADANAATMPFLGASRLMARGIGYAGEGDILTAALVAALARIAEQATFTEMFCPDYERDEVLLSHMGECNLALASPHSRVRLVAKPFAFGKCQRPAVPVFQLNPGPVTLACITQWPDEAFRIVACTAEVRDAPPHPNLRSPHSRIRFDRDLPPFLEDYSRVGGTHHLALAYGDRLDELNTLARFLDLGYAVV